jgi:hypothetical protein
MCYCVLDSKWQSDERLQNDVGKKKTDEIHARVVPDHGEGINGTSERHKKLSPKIKYGRRVECMRGRTFNIQPSFLEWRE